MGGWAAVSASLFACEAAIAAELIYPGLRCGFRDKPQLIETFWRLILGRQAHHHIFAERRLYSETCLALTFDRGLKSLLCTLFWRLLPLRSKAQLEL
jgi:hypothetical protein